MGKKISVIMPVFNEEDFLSASLESFFMQSFSDSCELICIDDGSTDHSIEILQAAHNAHPDQVKVLYQGNQGSGKARNAGIDVAEGEYIGFLDADDLYPNVSVLQSLYEAAETNGVNAAGGSLLFFDATQEYCDFSDRPGFEGHTFKADGLLDYMHYQFDYGYQRFLYKQTLFRDNNIRFPDYLRYQDPPFFVQCMIAAGRFFALREPTYKYRSATRFVTWDTRRATDMIKGMRDVGVMAAENNLEVLFKLNLMRFDEDWRPVFQNLIVEEQDTAVLDALLEAKDRMLKTKSELNLKELLSHSPSVLGDIFVALKSMTEYRAQSLSLQAEVAKNLHDHEITQGELARVLASTTWKTGRIATKPFRAIKGLLDK